MVSRLAGVIAATSALTAQAFLLPPGIQGAHELSALGALTSVNHDWEVIKLPCPDCVFPVKKSHVVKESAEDDTMWIQGGANSLMLNVSTIFDAMAIGLGDYPLYPPLASYSKARIDMVGADTSIAQVADGSAQRAEVIITRDESVVYEGVRTSDSDAFIRISYQILAIDNHPVTVDSIVIAASKRDDGKMAIVGVEVLKTKLFHPHSVGHKAPHARPCAFPAALCHIREVLASKMQEIQAKVQSHRKPGCQRFKGDKPDFRTVGHPHPPSLPVMFGARPAGFGPPHHVGGHHGKPFSHRFSGHHSHHRHSAVHRTLQAVLFVLVPIFLGITMGMVVSLVGMIVGRLISFLWTRFVRGGRRGYASVRLDEDEADDDAESVCSEPLPKYEHAPSYVQVPVYEDAPAYNEKDERNDA